LNLRGSAIAALALLIAIPTCAAAAEGRAAPGGADPRPELGVMGTLPLYWGEAEGLGDLLDPARDAHWARPVLERDYRLVPLDWLGETGISRVRLLLLAQPRPLAPEENVALDAWVRAGGRLLLFADPMLTGESGFAVGDRRRPQDVALLSPILAHWGLVLEFPEDQPAAMRRVTAADAAIPVRLAGRFVQRGNARDCSIEAEGLIAHCRLGAGRVLIVADAALLDLHDPDPASAAALSALMMRAFPQDGDNAGLAAHGRNDERFEDVRTVSGDADPP